MPDAPPPGGSVATTAAIAVPTGAALILLQYLVAPTWPPPEPVLTIAATALVPVAHLLGKAVMGRLTRVAAQIEAEEPPAPAVVAVQPAATVPPPPPPQPAPAAQGDAPHVIVPPGTA